MPREKATEADDVSTEDLEVQAGETESSTEGDEELDELLGQLHEGTLDLEDGEHDDSTGEQEELDEEERGVGEEEELSPSEQHSLAVATRKDQQIKQLQAQLAEREEMLGKLSKRQERIEELILRQASQQQQPSRAVETLAPSLQEQKQARVEEIVKRVTSRAPGGRVDFVTQKPEDLLRSIVGEMVDAQDRRTEEWIGQNPLIQELEETRRLSRLMERSPSLARFVANPETTKQLKLMRRDPQAMREAYSDQESNRQKAMLLDVMLARADGATKAAAKARAERVAGRKEMAGAFTPPAANRSKVRTKSRTSLQEKVAGLDEKQFGRWFETESRKAEAEEAAMEHGL